MKNLPTAVKGVLDRRTAIETVIFIGVEWTPGNEVLYSSHDYPGMRPNLISLSGLETSSKIDGSGASQSVSIVLSDIDGELRQILKGVDPHKVPARVYLSFADIEPTERVLLLDGQVNSPMVWAEGDRTFSFNILTRIESSEVGFSIQDGLFPEGDQQQRSAVWPTRFGTTCAYPTLRLTNPTKGFLGEGQGVKDPTIDLRICQTQKITCPTIQVALSKTTVSTNISLYPETAILNPQLYLPGFPLPNLIGVTWIPVYFPDRPAGYWPLRQGDDINSIPSIYSPTVPPGVNPLPDPSAGLYVSRPDPDCERNKFNILCQLLRDKADQEKYVKTSFQVRNGEAFPQNQLIKIRIKDVVFEGTMTGNIFSVSDTFHPALELLTGLTCQNIGPPSAGFRQTFRTPNNLAECATPSNTFDKFVVGGATEGWRRLDELPTAKFIWLPAGTEVLLDDSSEQIHIVSTIPGVVTQVMAYRTFGDTKILTIVPPKYYTVVLTNFGAFSVVEVRTTIPLSTIEKENWDDQIYASFVSTVGPNPVDVIRWIIDNYTSLVIDEPSFVTVRNQLLKYPANFVLDAKLDAVTLINNIARQARCAMMLSGNKVSLVYLSQEPSTSRFIRKEDIEVGSFVVNLSESESIVTKHVARFKESGVPIVGSDPTDRSLEVVNESIKRYGVSIKEENYFTISNEQQALKTATFWSIREGNTWKRVEFVTALKNIDLDAFDAFILDIPQFPTVKCVVESSILDGDQVRIVAWTPILSGTDEEYLWAWPASQPAGIRYPRPATDLVSPGPQIVVPAGHPLSGFEGTEKLVTTYGDPYPSDLDDVAPVLTCRNPTDSQLIDDIEPQFIRFDFPTPNSRLSAAAEVIEAQNISYNKDEDKEEGGCGGPGEVSTGGPQSCLYNVRLFYITPTLVATVPGDGGCNSSGPCTPDPGRKGRACAGPFDEVCHTFGSLNNARFFAATKRAEGAALWDNCAHFNGKRSLLSAASVFGPEVSLASNGGTACEVDETISIAGTSDESLFKPTGQGDP